MKNIRCKKLFPLLFLLTLLLSLTQQGFAATQCLTDKEITCNGVTAVYTFYCNTERYCGGNQQCLCDRRREVLGFAVPGKGGNQNISHPTAPPASGNSESTLRRSASQFFSWFTLSIGACAILLLLRRRWRFSLPTPSLLKSPAFSVGAVAILIVGIGCFTLLFPTLAPNGKRGKATAREVARHRPFQQESLYSPAKKAAAAALASTTLNPAPADQFTSAFTLNGDKLTQIGAAGYDSSGNLYITGGFQGSLQLTINSQPVTLTASQDVDFFLAKFNASNQCQWVRTATGATNLPGGFSIEGAIALAVDAQGNCFVGGGFVDALTFKDSQGATLAQLTDSNTDINVEPFVAKFSTHGNLAWANGGNSGSLDLNGAEQTLEKNINAVTEIVVDGAGNPYVTGRASGERFLGAGFAGRGAGDIVLARLQPTNGNVVWVQSAGGSDEDGTLGLTIDKAANVYLIGYFNDIARFPTTPPSFYDSLGHEDTFVSKFNANGQCQWVKQIGGEKDIIGNSIAVDDDNNLYLTGAYLGKAAFGATKLDSPEYISGFLVKMNADCEILWARSFGETADSFGDRVALDRLGQVFVLGTFYNDYSKDTATALFGQESLASPVGINTTDEDLLLAKYNSKGEFRWARGIYGTGGIGICTFCNGDIPLGYIPLRLVKNPTTNDLQLFGDFQGTLTLSDNNLRADLTSQSRVGFAAKLMHTCANLAFSTLPNARVNEAYNTKIALTSGDNPASFGVESVASLPPGLTLAANGTLAGTPTKPGVYTVKVNGSDAYSCNGSNTYQITVSTYEGDVAPRADGNGAVSIADWTQVGRFVAGLDTVQASEFQRADCAPRNTQGEGQLTIADWVQAGRYAVGLDTKAYAAGPAGANLLTALSRTAAFAPRLLAINGSSVVRAVASPESNTLLIQLDALGGENAFGFSLSFDPTALALADATPETGLVGGTLLLNDKSAAQGNIGFLTSLPSGQFASPGARTLLKLRFIPVGSQASTTLRFIDGAVKLATVDVNSQALSTTYVNAELPLQTRGSRSDRDSGGRRGATRRSGNR